MSDWLQTLHFLRPHWLWALAGLLPGIALWRWRQRRADAWRETIDPLLAPHVLVGARRRPWAGLALACLAYGLAVLALAGPSWRQQAQPTYQVRAPLVIALDLSSATLAGDLPPSRLLQARAKLASLLRERAGGEVALVAWADDAYTVAPLTDDAANVAVFLDALAPSVMPVDGQRADRAIAWSARLMRQAGFPRGRILLLTDHADATVVETARQEAAQGYATSVLGLGRPGVGAPALDEASLQALARAGQGRYARLQSDDGDLQALGVLDPRADSEAPGRTGAGRGWRDEGYWLLPPLLLLALLAFLRRAGTAGVLALLLLPALATLPGAADAAEPADGSWWLRPDQQRQRQLAEGVAAYRKGDYAAAQAHFARVDSDEGWYNLGNALARQGRYDEAIAAYDRALARHPGMADAQANRAAVEAARQQSTPPAKASTAQNGGRQGSSSQSSASAGSQSDPAQAGQPGTPGSKREPGTEGTPSQNTPADAGAQRQADAEQRRKMEQALARQRAQGTVPEQRGNPAGTAPVGETAAERERRQANEAWMRRIPDDPGSLLRNRFQLEYRRRQEGR